MTPEYRTTPRELAEAEQRLALIAEHEPLALQAERAALPSSRRWYAEAYAEIVGVHPEFRQQFQAALERIADGSGGRVQALIDHYRRLIHENGCAG